MFGRYVRVYLCIPLYILHYNLVWIVFLLLEASNILYSGVKILYYFFILKIFRAGESPKILAFHYPTDFTKLYGLETLISEGKHSNVSKSVLYNAKHWNTIKFHRKLTFPSFVTFSGHIRSFSGSNSVRMKSFPICTHVRNTQYLDTCSWKGQLERTRSWKVSLKLERTDWGWKARAEVGKWLMKLKSLNWTWKDSMKLESYNWTWKDQ